MSIKSNVKQIPFRPGTRVKIESSMQNGVYAGKTGEVIGYITGTSEDVPYGFVFSPAGSACKGDWLKVKFDKPFVYSDGTEIAADIFPVMNVTPLLRKKYIIAGMVGSGKSTLAKELQKHGLRLARSYTTRPRRAGEGDDYYFITKEEATQHSPATKVVGTHHGEYEYFMTEAEVRRSDIFVVDPNGINDLVSLFKEYDFALVLIKPANEALAEKMHDARDPKAKKFAERRAAEKDRFDKLDADLESETYRSKFISVHTLFNDYTKEFLELAGQILKEENHV